MNKNYNIIFEIDLITIYFFYLFKELH